MNDMIRKIRKTVMLPLLVMAVFACLCAVPSVVYAGGPGETVGSVNGTSYSDLEDMFDDIEDMEGKTITITMARDWAQDRDSWNDERLVLPKNSRVTFNLNGHMFNRWLSWYNDWESNGENICIRSGAVVTINGGDRTVEHRVGVYTGKDSDNKAVTYKTIKGGVIAGGCSANGAGGIHVESDVTLILNDVTLAGCRAECPWYDTAGTNSGYGGGIWIAGGNVRLTMNNSTITGCHAQQDGGGIFASNKNNVNIEMNESHVDLNYSRSDGGGIDLDGEKLTIKGDGKSSVSGNETNGLGGGIYLWNDEVTVSGLTISGNKAKYGGGIYTQEETIVLSDLVIKENEASENGGGIYVENDNTTIADCEIVDNIKSGVYVKGEAGDNVDTGFNIDGKTVIRKNRDGNLMMYDGSSHVSFAPVRGMDIRINYVVQPHHIDNDNWDWNISPDTAADSRQYVTSDNPDYYVTYSYYESPYSGRRMCFSHKDHLTEITGYPLEKVETVKLSVSEAAPKVVGSVGAGGDKTAQGNKFNLIRGILHREKTSSGTEDNDSVFYYSDGLFYGDPYVYNNHLATASWNLAFGGTYLREGAAEAASYKYKHTGARQFLADIGCPDQNIYVNDSNTEKPGTDSIGVIIGSKELAYANGDKTGDILIPIAVRGGGYEAEWASNVLLGSGTARNGEAQGFSEAADQVMSAVEYYIAKYELSDELAEGKVKFWVSGFSRAGATANLTSKRLIENYADGSEGKKNQVFAYPCEAAKGGTDKAQKLSYTSYYCIHNLINAADIVPLVGPEEMGFKRYGVDHYIPGTEVNAGSTAEYVALVKEETPPVARGGNSGIQTVTTYSDNERLRSKPAEYDDQSELYKDYVARRNLMINNLASIDSEILFNDYFRPRGLSITPLSFGQVGSYQGTYEEDFIIDFLSFMQQESIESRKVWAEDVTTINGTSYGTIQQAARDTMALLFSMSDESKASVSERLASLSKIVSFGNMFKLLSLYDDVLGDWRTLSEKDKEAYINELWDFVVDTGALEFLPEGEAAKLEKNWPVLANMIFNYTDGDWEARPGVKGYTFPSGKAWMKYDTDTSGHYMMYSLTLAAYVGQILRNHDPELNMAWARTYDDYYGTEDGSEDLKEYSVNWGNKEGGKGSYTSETPSAYTENAEGSDERYKELTTANSGNSFTGNQRIILETGTIGSAAVTGSNVTGEAIYYTLEDISAGEEEGESNTLAKEQLYRGGVDLKTDDGVSTKYKLSAYSRSYGVNSSVKTYYIDIASDRHKVTVNSGGTSESFDYREGEQVRVSAGDIADKYFTGWTVREGSTDVTELILGSGDQSKAAKRSVDFVMPVTGSKSGEYSWPAGYSLTFTANYADKIKTVTISDLNAPKEGMELDSTAQLSFDATTEKPEPKVTWSYETTAGDKTETVIHSGEAYKSTVYTASIRVPQDESNNRFFASTPLLTGKYKDTDRTVNVSRNDTDGSITLRITFDKTGESGESVRPDTVRFRIVAWDTNARKRMSDIDRNWHDPEMLVHQGTTITLTAPAVQDEVFSSWVIPKGSSGYSVIGGENALKNNTVSISINNDLSVTELNIYAYYIPVLNEVKATLAEPEAGEELPTTASLILMITNEFEVSPDDLVVTWEPAAHDGKAAYMTAYTATVKLRDTQEKIHVRPAGTDGVYNIEADAKIIFADNLSVTMNDSPAAYDKDSKSLSFTFDPIRYTLTAVKQPDNVSGLDNSKNNAAAVKAALPKTTKIVLDDGSEMDAGIVWKTLKITSGGGLAATVWSANGTVTLPEASVTNPDGPDGVSLEVSATVSVDEAPAAASPRASLASGTYLGNQVITLSTAATGGTIKYTTDGSDPAASGTVYNGEEIYFSRDSKQLIDETDDEGKATGRKMMLIRAVTQKSGMRDSNESVYKYFFTNELEVPKGNDLVWNGYAQTGVSAGLYYTLEAESEGVRIDSEGNAVATEPGSYRVRAKIAKGMQWKIRTEDGSERNADQTITFSIQSSRFDAFAEIIAKDSYDSLDRLRNDIKVVVKETGEEISEEAYEISYSNVVHGRVTVTVTGRGGFEGTITKTIRITDTPAPVPSKPVSIDGAEVVLSASSFVYNGRVRRPVIMTVGGKTLKAGTDYTIEWSNESSKNVGSYTVTITGIGNYTGTAEAAYKIRPKGTRLKKPVKAKKAVTVRWKKQSKRMSKTRITGYQIQLATDKKFTKNRKTVTVKGYRKVSKKIVKLKSKRRYYIRIRTYKTVREKRYYSGWSKIKAIKTR